MTFFSYSPFPISFHIVLVSLGHCNKIPESDWLNLLFLTILEVSSPQSKYWHIQSWDRALFLVCRQLPFHCLPTEREKVMVFLPLPIRTLISSQWESIFITSSKPNILTKVPSPHIITSGMRVSIYEFWGSTNIWSITHSDLTLCNKHSMSLPLFCMNNLEAQAQYWRHQFLIC